MSFFWPEAKKKGWCNCKCHTLATFDKDYSTYPFSVVKVSCKATDTKSGALSRALPGKAKTGLADTVLAETTILRDKLSEINYRRQKSNIPLIPTSISCNTERKFSLSDRHIATRKEVRRAVLFIKP